MQEVFPQPLSTGRSDFAALRLEKRIYVDKTHLIHDLCRASRMVLLTRPRRFGKSLLLSMMESLFRFGLRDFQGLRIEGLWTDQTYEVVRLDFSGIKGFENLESYEKALQSHIRARFAKAGFSAPDFGEINPFFEQFGHWMAALKPQSLVVLIDEYDAPLSCLLEEPELLKRVRAKISKFFAVLSENEEKLRFLFATGVLDLRLRSFSGGEKALLDISLDEHYAALLGFTQDEIERWFEPYVAEAASALHLTREELLEALHEHYAGFCFDPRGKAEVYCPWSILNFLERPEEGFRRYWVQSGGSPSGLRRYLEAAGLLVPELYRRHSGFEYGSYRIGEEGSVRPDVLLMQAGYLAIKSSISHGYLELGYPNKEVSGGMAALYVDAMLRSANLLPSGIPFLPKILAEKPLDKVVAQLNKAALALDPLHFPIRNDTSCRAVVELLLIGAAQMPERDVLIHGRSGLEVNAGSTRWCFTFGYCARGCDPMRVLSAAERALTSRQFGATSHGKRLLRAAIVFSEEERRVVAWKLL